VSFFILSSLVLYASLCRLFDFSFPFFSGLQVLWHQPMLALHRWKPSSVLRGKPFTLRPLPKRVLRSCISRHWLKRRKQRRPWPMLTKSISSESKPWLSSFTRCLLLLEVHTRLVFFFDCCCFLTLANTFLSCFFLVPFVVQDLPRCHCRLCNLAMIL
jgi:hypothetical protein